MCFQVLNYVYWINFGNNNDVFTFENVWFLYIWHIIHMANITCKFFIVINGFLEKYTFTHKKHKQGMKVRQYIATFCF